MAAEKFDFQPRYFDLSHLRPGDQEITWETIAKLGLHHDVELEFEGNLIQTSQQRAELLITRLAHDSGKKR